MIDTKLTKLDEQELSSVSGGGFFYNLGAFFAQQANINDSIRATYGRAGSF